MNITTGTTKLDRAARQRLARLLSKAKGGGVALLAEVAVLPEASLIRFDRPTVVNVSQSFGRADRLALTIVRGWIFPPDALDLPGYRLTRLDDLRLEYVVEFTGAVRIERVAQAIRRKWAALQ